MHLFVDISSHGLGHLAITAPVLDALALRAPQMRLTIRSGLRTEALRARIAAPFEHIHAASDFGYLMHDATRIDLRASAQAYRAAHARWQERVEEEASFLAGLSPGLVLSNVSCLPLAGAARAGLRAAALCSLNWADLFAHFFDERDWAVPIHAAMLEAYRSAALFLRPLPAMPMPALSNTVPVAPIALKGVRSALRLQPGQRSVLIAMGGIAHRIHVERWPRVPGVRWLVPPEWGCTHPEALPWDGFGLSFTDLLASVDVVITKPGYGTFTEAACNGTPVLYVRREDWPEQECLIEWLHAHGRCREVDAAALEAGRIVGAIDALLALPPHPMPEPVGAAEAACRLLALVRPGQARSDQARSDQAHQGQAQSASPI